MNFEQLHVFEKNSIVSLAINLSGSLLAVATSDNLIHFFVYDVENQRFAPKPHFPCFSPNFSINQIKFSSLELGSLLGVSDKNGSLYLYEENIDSKTKTTNNWSVIHEFNFPQEKINDFAFSPSFFGDKLAIATSFGVLRVFECADDLELKKWALICQSTFTTHIRGIKSISWCKNPLIPCVLAVSYEVDLHKNQTNNSYSEIAIYLVDSDLSKKLDTLPNPNANAENMVEENKFLNYSENVDWSFSLGKTCENIISCGRDGAYLWSFTIEDGNVVVKNQGKIYKDQAKDLSSFSKNSLLNLNSSLILEVKEDQNVFLIKENSDSSWNYAYMFKRRGAFP